MSALKGAALSTASLLAIGCVGYVLSLTERRSHSQTAMQHRVELLEENISRLEQRVVKSEYVLAEVLAVQTASPAKGVDAKSAAATKPPEELPVSVAVPQDTSVQARPAKHKHVARHQAPQGSEYPQMAKPYPWSEWEQQP